MDVKSFVDKIADTAKGYPHSTFNDKGKVYTCVNPYYYHIVKEKTDLYASIDGLFVDGMLMCKLIQFNWGVKIPRLSFDMSGMAPHLFSRLNAPDNSESIFFIGARQHELEGTVKQIRSSYPGIKIAGYRNGYFCDDNDRTAAIKYIVSLNPDFTLVGMGAPLQEAFALDLKSHGYKGIVFTCGGFLHQTSNRINYYPRWIDKYNLRAFYRLFKEKNLFRRLFNVLIEFPCSFTFDSIKRKRRSMK